MANQIIAIVPAAGIGSRMQADIPKQYLTLDGQLLIQHTLRRLAQHDAINKIIVALKPGDPYWGSIKGDFLEKVTTVEGGDHRMDSVINAMSSVISTLDNDDWFLVHDAARPCVNANDISLLIDKVKQHSCGGLLAVKLADTIKQAKADGSIDCTLDRELLWRAMTPQMFRAPLLYQAYLSAQSKSLMMTDESAAIEAIKYSPLLVDSDAKNVKVTTPHDLILAEYFLQSERGGN